MRVGGGPGPRYLGTLLSPEPSSFLPSFGRHAEHHTTTASQPSLSPYWAQPRTSLSSRDLGTTVSSEASASLDNCVLLMETDPCDRAYCTFENQITHPPINHKAVSAWLSSLCEAPEAEVVESGKFLPALKVEKPMRRRSNWTYTMENNRKSACPRGDWPYMGEVNVGCHTQTSHAGDRVAKKRKFSESPQSPSRFKNPSSLESWELNENDDIGPPNHSHGRNILGPRLPTPPGTTSKCKGKGPFNIPDSRVAQPLAFKNLTITKPLLPQEKPSEELTPLPQAARTHRRWMTTQDVVRSGGNGIAKTTLNKLDTFRYKGISQNSSTDTADTQLLQHPRQLHYTVSEVAHHVSDGTRVTKSDSSLGQGLRDTKIRDLHFSEVDSTHNRASQSSTGGAGDTHQPRKEDIRLISGSHALRQYLFETKFEVQQEFESDFLTRQTHYDRPTYGSSQELHSILGGDDLLEVELQSARSEVQILPVPWGKSPGGGSSKGVDQVLRQNSSDIGVIDTKPSQSSEDHGTDEFNEGLDDADLSVFILRSTSPDMNCAGSPTHRERDRSRPNLSSPSCKGRWLTSRSTVQINRISKLRVEPPLNTKAGTISFPQTSGLNLTRYATESEEEEEMLQFSDPSAEVIQTSLPPVSAQQNFGHGFGYLETGRSSLCISSPRGSLAIKVLPLKESDDHTTNNSDPYLLAVDDCTLLYGRGSARGDGNSIPTLRSRGVEPVRSSMDPPLPPYNMSDHAVAATKATRDTASVAHNNLYENEPLGPFVRRDFPLLARDRCPIIGVSTQCFLRVCFRVGEMFRESARCNARNQDAVIELFARVAVSSRETHTTKQHFQFADLWSDKPPFPTGVLMNYKTTSLVESESRVFVGGKEGKMARCLGRFRRDKKSATGWVLNVINIRETEWEEIRWTKRIVGAGRLESESVLSSNS